MMNQKNNLNSFFEDMLRRGLISTSNNWIEKAIEQKNPRLPISIAASKLLIYDMLDFKLITLGRNN